MHQGGSRETVSTDRPQGILSLKRDSKAGSPLRRWAFGAFIPERRPPPIRPEASGAGPASGPGHTEAAVMPGHTEAVVSLPLETSEAGPGTGFLLHLYRWKRLRLAQSESSGF